MRFMSTTDRVVARQDAGANAAAGAEGNERDAFFPCPAPCTRSTTSPVDVGHAIAAGRRSPAWVARSDGQVVPRPHESRA